MNDELPGGPVGGSGDQGSEWKPGANGAGISLKINEMRTCDPCQGFWEGGAERISTRVVWRKQTQWPNI
jgi:hypothetical protein